MIVNADLAAQRGTETNARTSICAAELDTVLQAYPHIKMLSLDCFDTLIWRLTDKPRDIFNILEDRPLFQSLEITASQRVSAAALAYRQQFIQHGNKEINLADIYQHFTSLSIEQRHALINDELSTEVEMSFAFEPIVKLIEQALTRNIRLQIVSDTYFNSAELSVLLKKHLPANIFTAIDKIFCSSEYGKSKSTGLFDVILQQSNLAPNDILHIGDHVVADYEAPKRSGIHSLHFIQFQNSVLDLFKMQRIAASLASLNDPNIYNCKPNFQPFRGLFSFAKVPTNPASIIGYLTFGPILYTFARFITDEIASLKAVGKSPKVFFLLRDGHLLEQACTAYAGESLGKRVRIRKFVAVAASFRTQEDIDFYLLSITPQYYNFYVICEQLLLPAEITQQIIAIANSASDPLLAFNQLLHQQDIMQFVFKQSAEYRARLRKYFDKELQLKSGDTLVLVDVGYVGVTQKHLQRTFAADLNIEILGRYLIASNEPDRPECKSLFTSKDCDHGLLEQSCTLKEGAVLDYDQEGNPIYDKIKLQDAQYTKVAQVQAECLRFINDARQFYSTTQFSFSVLQNFAFAALRRHIYLPVPAELDYFQTFQHDKDMGANGSKTMFNLQHAKAQLKCNSTVMHLHPYEMRATSMELALSAMVNRAAHCDLLPEDMQINDDNIKLIVIHAEKTIELNLKLVPTHNGYFTFSVPAINQAKIAVLFGLKYQWLQIDNINLSGGNVVFNHEEISKSISTQEMINRKNDIYECLSQNSMLVFSPNFPDNCQQIYYHITLRPLVNR